jgi:hypothetical protein
MTYFTIITGAATLLSLFLQVSGLFPNYKRYVSHATLFFLGMTAGLLVNFGSSLNVSLPQVLTPKEVVGLILFGGTALLIFILIILSVIIEDSDRRSTATYAASAVSTFLIFLLLFFLNSFFPQLFR